MTWNFIILEKQRYNGDLLLEKINGAVAFEGDYYLLDRSHIMLNILTSLRNFFY